MASSHDGATSFIFNVGQSIVTGDMVTGDKVVYSPGRPRVLPHASEPFVGRSSEAALLERRLLPGAAVLITGRAGSGKTTLAIEVAHRLAERFPDGMLFTSLARGREAFASSEVFATILRELGVTSDRIPIDPHERILRYRATLEGRRLLLILDDATDAEQIRALIPPPPSTVLIISRKDVLGLVDLPFHRISLDVLSEADAVEFLRRSVGTLAEQDESSIRQIAELCGGLPLALAIAAGRLRDRPAMPAAQMARRLAETRPSVDHRSSIRSIFDLSFRELAPEAARALRTLAWLPVNTMTVDATAATLEMPVRQTEALLEGLLHMSLLQERSRGRFGLHDLIRIYARDSSDVASDIPTALRRFYRWYLHRTGEAVRQLRSESAATRGTAAAWLESEQPNVIIAARDALARGEDDVVWQLADTWFPLYQLGGDWPDCQTLQELALTAARQSGNKVATARILDNLGGTLREQRRYREAITCLEESISLATLNDALDTVAIALMNLGIVYRETEVPEEAEACLNTALRSATDLALTSIAGKVLTHLGSVYRDTGRFEMAFDAYEDGLQRCRSAGDMQGEAAALVALGSLHAERGEFERAVASFGRGIVIAQESRDRVGEARARRQLGTALAASGSFQEAFIELSESFRIAEESRDVGTIYLAGIDLATLHARLGDVPKALNRYEASRRQAQAVGDSRMEAKVAMAIASLVEARHDAEAALPHWRQAVVLFREARDQRGVTVALLGLAGCLVVLGREKQAVDAYEEAAAVARDRSDHGDESAALSGLLKVLRTREQTEDADAVERRLAELRNEW